MKPSLLHWHCRCGALRARVSLDRRDARRRAVCHCRDCQAFQHVLGTAVHVLDAHGGTDIAMLSPTSVAFVAGREHLAALRLSPTGLLRWHSACCSTPLGNTPPYRALAHVGLVAATLIDVNGSDAVEAAFGPVRERIFGRHAPGGSAPDAHPKVPLGSLPPIVLAIAGRVLRGEHRRGPFFDADGRPSVVPRVLSEAERDGFRP